MLTLVTSTLLATLASTESLTPQDPLAEDPLAQAARSLQSADVVARRKALIEIAKLRPDLAVGCKRAKTWVEPTQEVQQDMAVQLVLAGGWGGLQAIKVVLPSLRNSDEQTVIRTLNQIIADPSQGTDRVDEMLELLTSESTGVRAAALHALATQDIGNVGIRDALSDGRKDASAPVRRGVAAGLGVCVSADFAIPHLRALLQDPDDDVRRMAVQSLGRHGPKAVASEGEIAALVRDRIPAVRRTAIHALTEVGAKAPRSLAVVARATTDKDRKVVLAALRALRIFGPRAMPHVAAIDTALDHEREDIRVEATRAKGTVNPEDVLTFLRMLQDPGAEVQKRAGEALKASWRAATRNR